MRRIHLLGLTWIAFLGACSRADSSKGATEARPVTIVNATIMDGSGAPGKRGSLRIVGDRIAAIGDSVASESGDEVIDAKGMVVAPGFIDTHSHADDDLREDTTALAAVSQGITTIIGGQDGGSPGDLAAYFADIDKRPPPVNVGMYVGHNSVRDSVMGKDFKRVAKPEEVEKMRELVRQGMSAGAIGLSSGLEYDPGIYSSSDEVMTLAKEAAAQGGRYISHIRSEDFAFWQAIDEIIRIGRETKMPVQISHTKLGMRGIWNQGDSLIHVLDRARASGVNITADVYPYLYWQSTITVLFPKRDFENRKAAEFALTQTSTPAGILLTRYAPNAAYEGKTVAEVAAMRGVDSVTALIDLVKAAEDMRAKGDTPGGVEGIIATSMVEPDVETIMKWPFTNICTDGSLVGKHPRGFGTFPRFFGHYIRDQKVMSVEEGVRRTSALAAEHMGIKDRGVLRQGAYADIVMFDPATIADKATPKDPHAVSVGVQRVWVNGKLVYVDGRATGAHAGKALRRAS